MKIISWNVNGIRACINKGFFDFFVSQSADIFCIQEVKMQSGQAEIGMSGFHHYLNSAEKKGYAGTACYCKREPIKVSFGVEGKHIDEGRVITLEYENFFMVCCYAPNSQDELKRIDYRMLFEDDIRQYLVKLNKIKPVIYAGDLNVANEPIDLKHPERNEGATGYSVQERGKFKQLLAAGFVDAFRYKYPDRQEFTWWSYRTNARVVDSGWRIDYFLVSDSIKDKVRDCKIFKDVMGSDHAPILLDIDI